MPANYTLLYFCELIYRERIKANLNWSKKLILYFPFCEIFNILLDQLSFYFVFCWIHSDFILLDPLRFYFAGSTQILFHWIHSDFISLDPLRFYFSGSTQILFYGIHSVLTCHGLRTSSHRLMYICGSLFSLISLDKINKRTCIKDIRRSRSACRVSMTSKGQSQHIVSRTSKGQGQHVECP